MANRISIVALLGLAVCMPAFSQDEAKLKDSLTTWRKLRQQCGGNYSYKIRRTSFSGFGHETEVIVNDNKVAERRYHTFNTRPIPDQPAPKPAADKWTETGKQIGTHKEGAAALTLDELYTQAAKVLKRELPEHERLYLRFDKQGLLKSCFTVDTRIADDAPIHGVIITSIALKTDSKIHKAPNGKVFPAHWGAPPLIQTRDLRPLPGGYGRGSGTLAKWIQKNLDRDAKKAE